MIAIFRLASALPWEGAVRLLAMPFVALLIGGAAWAGRLTNGDRGARWGALVGAAMMTTPLASGQVTDGELLAAPFVMVSIGLTLTSLRRAGWGAFGFAVLAGTVAGLAIATKQSFCDGVVFAATLALVSAFRRELSPARSAGLLAAGAFGLALVAGATAAYAVESGVGVGELWYDLIDFRGDALRTLASSDLSAPLSRAGLLLVAALLSGALPLAGAFMLTGARRRAVASPVEWAVRVTIGFEVFGIAAGGSYWSHYLLQLTPMLALAAALRAPSDAGVRRWSTGVILSASVSAIGLAVPGAATRFIDGECGGVVTGRWLAGVATPGETATVLFGHAETQLASGMESPYEHLWSLPARTLDPTLDGLYGVLTTDLAPSWVVVWSESDDLKPDTRGRIRAVLARDYDRVPDVCGHQVWHHP